MRAQRRNLKLFTLLQSLTGIYPVMEVKLQKQVEVITKKKKS